MTHSRSLTIGVLACLLSGACSGPPDTPLTTAIALGDYAKAQRLLEDRADPNQRGHAGWTPLYVAVMHDQNEIAKLLLAAGADVNRRSVAWFYSADGRLPLQLAALRGNTEMVRLLLEQGAKVDAKDFQGQPTALMSAARSGSPEIVELLIAHGANVNAQDRRGGTPLDYAAGGREGMNVWTRENARVLIEHGADVNSSSPLFTAASAGDVPVLLLLIEHGASVDVRTKSGDTVLTTAATRGRLQATQVLASFFRDDPQAIDHAMVLAKIAGQESTAGYLAQLLEASPVLP